MASASEQSVGTLPQALSVMRGHDPMRANLSLNPQPLCHAPLYAGHPVIPAREVEVKPCQIGRSVITGSSAYADDDDRGYGNRLKLAPMGHDPRIHLLRKRSLGEEDGLHRTSGMPRSASK
jgi:hypothetical protein